MNKLIYVNKAKDSSTRTRAFLIVVFCLIAILQSGMRDTGMLSVGNDTVNYQAIYEKVSDFNWLDVLSDFSFIGSEYEERDGGYPIFIKVTQIVSTDFRFFMFLTAIVFIVPFGLLISRYVKTNIGVILSFLIYFALFTNIVNSFMRQAIALGVFLFALRYVIARKWKKYYIMILAAFTIHNSAIVVLPFYFLPKLKLKRKWTLFIIVLLPFIIYYIRMLMSYFLEGTVYSNYISSEVDNPVNYIIFVIGVSLFAYIYYNDLKSIPNNDILICGVIGSLVLIPIVFMGNTMLRISYYYVIFLIPLIPALLDRIKMNRTVRSVVYALSIIILLYYIYR